MTNISRRNVAKGVAWSVPAVSISAAAPAMAASGTTTCTTAVTCGDAPLKQEAGSAVFIEAVLAGSTYKGGSYFTINAGEWIIDKQPTYTTSCSDGTKTTTTIKNTTGYYLYWGGTKSGTGPVANVVGSDGKSYQGQLTLSTPVGNSPQTAGAGLDSSLGLQTSIPYNGDVCNAFANTHQLSSVSVPITVAFLDGLTIVGSCNYTVNMTFKTGGCQPNPSTSVTITAG